MNKNNDIRATAITTAAAVWTIKGVKNNEFWIETEIEKKSAAWLTHAQSVMKNFVRTSM